MLHLESARFGSGKLRHKRRPAKHCNCQWSLGDAHVSPDSNANSIDLRTERTSLIYQRAVGSSCIPGHTTEHLRKRNIRVYRSRGKGKARMGIRLPTWRTTLRAVY